MGGSFFQPRSLFLGFYIRFGGFWGAQVIRFYKTFSHIFQECAHVEALEPGRQAHARMTVSGFRPKIFVSNCLMQVYIKCSELEYARKVFDRLPDRDRVSWNKIIYGYSNSGELGQAQTFFDMMPQRDVISWNSLISGYVRNKDLFKAMEVYLLMRKDGVGYDETTLALVLKVCSGLGHHSLGIQLHGMIIKAGFENDLVAGSGVLDMYAKSNRLEESRLFFEAMPMKNWVSWSAMIAGCVQNNDLYGGLEFFKEMQRQGIGVSQSTYASVLRSCASFSSMALGCQLHAHSLKNDFGADAIVVTAMIDTYAKCGDLKNARKLFDSSPNLDLQSYNALITGYSRADCGFEGLELFLLLLKSSFGFDAVSLSGALSSCAVIKGNLEGGQVHGLAIKTPLQYDICVTNAILDMYGKCGMLGDALRVFDEMEIRDSVSWNSVITACEQNQNEDSLLLFLSMLRFGMEPDVFTYGSVLKACTSGQVLSSGREIHGRVIKCGMGTDTFVGSVLVDMYSKCGVIEDAEKLHWLMEDPALVSWNAIISGFSMNEESDRAQVMFSKMLEAGCKPDSFTYAAVLDTCSNIANAGLGRQIHAQIIKEDMQSDPYIISTLVDMYSKGGNMQDAVLIFDKSSKCDFVTWNAMICAYAHHGHAANALQVFKTMQLHNIMPNHATFVAVLRACSHMGLVDDALRFFNSMSTDYGLEPELEHYSSMVEILGKSGRLADALGIITKMPFSADDVIWRTLLSMCKMHGNVEVAETAATSLLKLDPQDSSAYILLSNIYADAEMWVEVAKLRKIMKDRGLKKEPGCSWIELQSEVHMFLVGDRAHPKRKEIYQKLDLVIWEMKKMDGSIPEDDHLSPADEHEELYAMM